ncbi:MAG: hypothetical protein ACFFB2_07615 [Promethearchaeota archaeon]
MSQHFGLEKGLKQLSKDISEELSRFNSQETNYEWNGEGVPTISDSEDIHLVLEGKFTLFKEEKLNNSTIIWTSERVILYGSEIRKSLLSNMVSREVEQRRGLERKHGELSLARNKGWDLPHRRIKKIEIIKNAAIYSIFAFSDKKRLYIINDLDYKEAEVLKTLLVQKGDIEIIEDEFQIPKFDILLLCLGGIGLTIVGWFLIVLFL